ncbi:MAG: YggS family pyridoxal phosphate-dependent enzyme [Termitinemataceae bacterium]
MTIRENLQHLEERIQDACIRSGRSRHEIMLMGVSKFQSREKMVEAYEAGIRLFGESRVQEAQEKLSGHKHLLPLAEFHFIGPLQRNKVKPALGLFSCIQSVDRNELLMELEKRAGTLNTTVQVLLELHTGEETKTGYPNMEQLLKAVEVSLTLPHIHLQGLMTMAPFTTDEMTIRKSFRALFTARNELEKRYPELQLPILSMGMSNDFELAIEEGSTLLRIGSALFGEKP